MIETLAVVDSRTPRGNPARFVTRDSTNDAALVSGIMGEDEYRFRAWPVMTGWALDIGAHIGIVSVLLALDNPDLRIVAVEALPDNADMVRRNVALNGIGARVEVVDAAATDDLTTDVAVIYDYEWVGLAGRDAPVVDTPYVRDSRFIGNIFSYPEGEQQATTLTRPGIGLARLLDERGIDRVVLAKLDCEGCEWAFLRSPAVVRVDNWIGEYHDTSEGIEAVRKAIGRTHRVTNVGGAHVGLFKAVRRAPRVTNAWVG